MSPLLISMISEFSYLGLFLLLAGAAIVVPIPEELTLLGAGSLLATGMIGMPWTLVAAFSGLLVGDLVLFYLARLGGTYAQKLRTRINKIGLEKTWIFSPSQPLRSVWILRFITGFRFIAPIYAGFEGVKWRWYVLSDIAVLVVFVPLMLGLGYAFHTSILPFIAGFEIVRHAVFLIVLAFAGAGMLPVLYTYVQKQTRSKNSPKKHKK